MQCTSPVIIYNKDSPERFVEVPCGHCLGCRISHSREWAVRLMHELPYWDKSCFVTLTYDDVHLPEDNGIHKEDLQLYFKRVRRDLDGKKFKYFACGEYGDRTKRPHYHGIFFGVGQEDKQMLYENWAKCKPERFHVGTVSYDSCRYVCDYILKKYNGEKARSEYGDRQVPFQLISKGFGLQFALENEEKLKEMGFIYEHGSKMSIPRYYLKKLNWKPEKNLDEKIESRKPFWKEKDKMKIRGQVIRLGFGAADEYFSRDSNRQKALNVQSKSDLFTRPL